MNPAETDWRSMLADAIYPRRCALCAAVGEPPICEGCRTEIELAPPDLVPSLGGGPSRVAYQVGVVTYRGRGVQCVTRLKYSRALSLAAPMATMVAERVDEMRLLTEVDAVIPVPIHWSRRFERGFNQSELLAEALPPGVVHADWLLRTRPTRPQASLSPSQRLNNLRGAFRATVDLRGNRILLLDDVLTTGGTAEACAEALLEAGALQVGVLVFALGRPTA